MATILVVDDEDKYIELCRRFLPEHKFVGPARSYRETIELLRQHEGQLDLVLLDMYFDIDAADLLPVDRDRDELLPETRLARMRALQGLAILDHLRRINIDLPIVLLTSRADLPPDQDIRRFVDEELTFLLDDEYLDARALQVQVEQIVARQHRVADEEPFYWGKTQAMARLRRRVAILARGQLPIMIVGPTGAGKSLLAREYVHARSGRQGNFVAVDLSTIPSELMAAHLFGVVRGAYTGAVGARDGVLATAHGGTLFLDEIGNLSSELQKSLLQVLQERRYRPVGSVEEKVADIKLVVATNEDLPAMIRAGKFREDLYMRLNPATCIQLPGLRQRGDDFPGLLRHFLVRVAAEPYNRDLLEQYARAHDLRWQPGMPVEVVTQVPERNDSSRIYFVFPAGALRLLQEAEWPGSFRQFEMVLSNLLTLTIVEIVERPTVAVAVQELGARQNVIAIQLRTVIELLRPWEERSSPAADASLPNQLAIVLEAQETLNAVSCAVERQYMIELHRRYEGNLSEIARVLLGDPLAARKIQLRFNQLGIKVRELRGGPASS